MDTPGPIWGNLLLQIILIAINAFFASTEIAVISLNENKLKRQLEEGDQKAARLLRMVESPSQFLSTIQIGITLAGYLGSAFAASTFAAPLAVWLQEIGLSFVSLTTLETICVVVITLILSYFTLVFGELVPKRVAMQHSDKVARFASGVIHGLATVMKPIIWFLTISTNGVLRLMRINPNNESEPVTEEEIRMMVDIGEEKGAIESGEAELIENIFEFNNLTAGEVMVHRTDVSALSLADTDEVIIHTILETGFSRFPVYDEDIDDIVGTLSTREYLLNTKNAAPKALRELLRPAYFVPETVRADVLLRDMQKTKTHMAIVVDEYGGTSGLVTMEDLLEQIVGDIFDEFDPLEEQDIVQLESNLWRVSGSADLDAVNEALNVDVPLDEEFDTLGGLVYSRMSAIPEDGSTPLVEAFGLNIQVEKIEDRRVESALVSKLPPDAAAQEPEKEGRRDGRRDREKDKEKERDKE